MNPKLWCDCSTTAERIEFLKSGRAVETGVIAAAVVPDIIASLEHLQQTETYIANLEIQLNHLLAIASRQ